MIHWEMFKKFRFDHMNNIQTDHLISARRPDLIINNKKGELAKLSTLPDHRIKLKECEKKDNNLDLARELKNYGTCR